MKSTHKNNNNNAGVKPRLPSSWRMVKLGDVCEVRRGQTITKKQTVEGDVPVVAGGTGPAYYHNVSNREAPVITVSASGTAGFVNFFRCPIWASDCSTIQPLAVYNEGFRSQKARAGSSKKTLAPQKKEQTDKVKAKIARVNGIDKREWLTQSDVFYIYYTLKSMQQKIYQLKRGAAQPHVYAKDLIDLTIPLPPFDVQKQIVKKIEVCFKLIDAAEGDVDRVDDLLKKSHKSFMQQALSGQILSKEQPAASSQQPAAFTQRLAHGSAWRCV